jgi:ADP-ribosyl-[dinitrogen reductase] hydrolase
VTSNSRPKRPARRITRVKPFPHMTLLDRHRGCLLGLACGDAVGTTVEFKPRGSFPPVTDMVGGGPFGLPVGAWTDDTSMALCLATSLVERGGFDPIDQLERYVRWRDHGYLSSTGHCFDIGITINQALSRFQTERTPWCGPTDARSAGNGCLMRLAPVPMMFHRDPAATAFWSGESARTTHGAPECVEASQLMGRMLGAALNGASADETLFGHSAVKYRMPRVKAIASGEFSNKSRDQVSGSGYVIHCLEAAAWCVHNSASFEEAVLLAVNLGDDADTTGAVAGQLAGALYGVSAIPTHWLRHLVMADAIRTLADQLHARLGGP